MPSKSLDRGSAGKRRIQADDDKTLQRGRGGVRTVGNEPCQSIHKTFCDSEIQEYEGFQRGRRCGIWQQKGEGLRYVDITVGDKYLEGREGRRMEFCGDKFCIVFSNFVGREQREVFEGVP